MKRTQKAPWFIAGMLCTAILVNTVAPAAAALVAKTIQVYTGIEVFVDDMRIDAGETHGNPDAFAYNGTTYVAVAAISKSLGENVIWDGENQRVYIGEHEGTSHYLLDVCPPYQYSGLNFVTQAKATSLSMAGKKYTNGFQDVESWTERQAYALFNLNGQYSTMSFVKGHVDGAPMYDGRVLIYLDGELAHEFEIKAESLPSDVEVDLTGTLSMKVVIDGFPRASAIADIKIS